jgi:hypothetical protein
MRSELSNRPRGVIALGALREGYGNHQLVAYGARLTPAAPATCRPTYVNRIESWALIRRVMDRKTVSRDPVDRGLMATAFVAALTAFLICCQLP